ncbi:hypothetical protein Ga0074812_105395 [Parafrankia irregularis]|uniref:Uncharacterized protein n=1 Tax=Parafrankia irregularis TaxID=795642 RepID=A0A0S4QLN9_9ACTN|nr:MULTISPECIES: hypothetical protein [Parafrankia]MBE3205366.1 hypothetical protein [Parafrankia sp. CH37]CUU55740.1 hypothetical protein Ga0074812_105395 [Parafrankia irregularis]
MVELRSGRQDRALLLIVWGLTLVVLVLGVLTLSPILLVWGVIGLPAAVALGYVHVRDTRRQAGSQGATPGRPAAGGHEDGLEDGIEEESSR